MARLFLPLSGPTGSTVSEGGFAGLGAAEATIFSREAASVLEHDLGIRLT